jgi:hypothetical protein
MAAVLFTVMFINGVVTFARDLVANSASFFRGAVAFSITWRTRSNPGGGRRFRVRALPARFVSCLAAAAYREMAAKITCRITAAPGRLGMVAMAPIYQSLGAKEEKRA